MKRLRSASLSLSSLMAVLALGAVGCSSKIQETDLPKLAVTHPQEQRVEIQQKYVAQIRGIQHIELRTFEKGYLHAIFVDEGQAVKKGQKLFQIMPALANAEFEKAKAEFETSKIEYLNTKNLALQNVVSRNELALAKAKLDGAEAELHLAKTHLEMTTITAPFDGIVGRFQARLGSMLEEGETLTTVSDISRLWVYFNVSEADYLAYMASKHAPVRQPLQYRQEHGREVPL